MLVELRFGRMVWVRNEIRADSQPVLSSLMASMPSYASELDGTFANHTPMVLVAAARLGASPTQMLAFANHYAATKKTLSFQDSAAVVTVSNWRTMLGMREHEGAYRRFFALQQELHGTDVLLRDWLPLLAPGVGASAFHALMRTAYAVLNEDDVETVNGLAYWCATWLPMPASRTGPCISADPALVLLHAGALPGMRGLPVHDLLWKNMRQSFELESFKSASDWLVVDDTTLIRCAGSAIALFAATQDFCALHAVTGLHWIRMLQPFNPATQEAVRYFWAGIAGLMNEMGYPRLPSSSALNRWRAQSCPDWHQILDAACRSFDEHDLSLVFTCWQEELCYGDPLYRRAAARRLGMISEMT